MYAPHQDEFLIADARAQAKLADWLEFYAVAQDLVIWNSSTVLSDPAPVYDSETRRWTLVVDCAGTQRTIRPAHVVLATGTLGRPYMPSVPGIEAFRGEAVHACKWNGGRGYKDKRVFVVGAANTAADVAQDVYANGAASVTILQRSSTCLVSGEWSRRTFGANFPPERPLEVSDFKYAGTPWGLIEQVARAEMHKRVDIDAELKAGLNAKGFLTNDGRDGLGRSFLVVERFAGEHIPLGTWTSSNVLRRSLSVCHILSDAQILISTRDRCWMRATNSRRQDQG
jgi:cation diffusion facilitator CzcD-associated flavoprotein CzcO